MEEGRAVNPAAVIATRVGGNAPIAVLEREGALPGPRREGARAPPGAAGVVLEGVPRLGRANAPARRPALLRPPPAVLLPRLLRAADLPTPGRGPPGPDSRPRRVFPPPRPGWPFRPP